MKIEELKNLSKEELLQKEKSLKDEIFKLNAQRYSGRVEKPHMFALIKKDIARIKTILSPVRNKAIDIGSKGISNGVNLVRNKAIDIGSKGISNGVNQKKDK